MDIYRINTPEELLENNTYPGRGIIIGKTPDGKLHHGPQREQPEPDLHREER